MEFETIAVCLDKNMKICWFEFRLIVASYLFIGTSLEHVVWNQQKKADVQFAGISIGEQSKELLYMLCKVLN